MEVRLSPGRLGPLQQQMLQVLGQVDSIYRHSV